MKCPQCERMVLPTRFNVSSNRCKDCLNARVALCKYWRLDDVRLPLNQYKSFRQWLPWLYDDEEEAA